MSTPVISSISAGTPVGAEDLFFMSFDPALVAIPDLEDSIDTTGITSVDIKSIDALLLETFPEADPDKISLKIHEDGGLNAGCGGKLWLSGKLLSLYLLKHWDDINAITCSNTAPCRPMKKIVELGSGTGVVGLSLGLLLKQQQQQEPTEQQLYLTDLPMVLPVLNKNVELNNLQNICSAQELDWFNPTPPEYLTKDKSKVDLVLVADCVYDEKLFEILVNTLTMLCNLNHDEATQDETVILFTWKKRRRSNLRFFKMVKKSFHVDEIMNYEGFEEFQKQRCHLFKMTIKR